MNHSINIGSTVDSLVSGFLNTSKPDRKNSEFSSDFFSLLQNQLNFSADSRQSANHSGLISNNKNTGFEMRKSSTNTVNPWERPEIRKYESKESSISKKEQSQNEPKEKVVADTQSKSENEIKENEKAKKAPANEDLELDHKAAAEEISQLAFADLSQNEINSLMEFMAQLEPSELEAISENPELLVAQISEAIEQIDNLELKNELAKIVESEEFAKFVANLAHAAQPTNEQNSAKDQIAEELVKPAEAVKSNEAANQKRMQSQVANNSTNSSAETVEEADPNQQKSPETGKEVNEVTEHSEEKSSKHRRSDRQKPADSNAEATRVRNESTQVTPKETLRQEFQKTITKEVPVNESVQVNETSEGQSLSNEKVEAILHKQINANKSANVLPEEVSKRFIALLTGKESNSQTKSFTYSNYGPVAQKDTKASTSQNNANSGFGNGFSSNSGTSMPHAVRQAPSGNNNVFLSQLLEKAEMLKFSDGKKVLSLEMDPKELGKMEMELTSKDGTVTAKISAESELARIKLEELAPQIKEQLSNQGINLAEITVDISSKNPDERNNKQMSERQNKSSRAEKIGANSDEQIIRDNILPNLRKVALNIQSVDLTV